MGWNNSPVVPPDPEVTQFQPGDSSMLKMLKVVRWALLRGGTFTPMELKRRFGTTKCMAYSYHREWVKVFGHEPPPRARVSPNKADPLPAPRINLDSLLGE
jgi:hypothetical protein